MSNRNTLIAIGALLVALMIFAKWYDGGFEQQAEQLPPPAYLNEYNEPETEADPLAVTAVELEKAFEDNEVAAQMKYGAGPLLISGELTAITLDGNENATVHIDSGALLSLTATLPPAQTAIAAELKKGQSVAILCQAVSEMLGKPRVKNCELQQ